MVLQSVGVGRQKKPPVLPRWDMERNGVSAEVKAKSSSLPNYARSNYSVFQHLHKTNEPPSRSPMYESAENIAARGADKGKGKAEAEKKKKWSIGGWFRRRKKSGGDESSDSSDADGSKRGGFLVRRRSKREKKRPEIIHMGEQHINHLELPENGQPMRMACTNGIRGGSKLQVPGYQYHHHGNYLDPYRNDSLDRLSRSSHDSCNSRDKRNLKTGSSSSIDSISRRFMREATKAKVEAIRENLRDSSSDEGEGRKNNSLNRFHSQESMRSDGSANRKSKSARMERYLKRLSRDYEAKMQERQKENHHLNVPKWAATVVYQESNGLEPFKSRSASSSPTQSPHMRQRLKLQNEPIGDLPVYPARLATTRLPSRLPGHTFGYRQCSFDRLSEPSKKHGNTVIDPRYPNNTNGNISVSCEELKRSNGQYPENNAISNKGSIFELGIPYPRKREEGRPPTPPPRDPRNRYYRLGEIRPASMAFGMHDYINIDRHVSGMSDRVPSNGHISQPYKHVPFPPRPLSSEATQRSYSAASSTSLNTGNSTYLSTPSPQQGIASPSSSTTSGVYSYTDQPPALPPKQRRPIHMQLSQYECDNLSKIKCNYTDDMKNRQVESSRSGSLDTKSTSCNSSIRNLPLNKAKGFSNSWGSRPIEQNAKNSKKHGFPIKNLRDMFEAKSLELQPQKSKPLTTVKSSDSFKIFSNPEKSVPKSKFYTDVAPEKIDSETEKSDVRGVRPLSMVLEKSESTEKESSAGEQTKSPSDKTSPPRSTPSRKTTRRTSLETAEESIDMIVKREKEKQNNANFEEAITELEAIYQSLKLNDEDLLDRAERRDLPEQYQKKRALKGKGDSPIDVKALESLLQWSSAGSYDSVKSGSRPRTPSLRRSAIPDKLTDDMAYRKIQDKKPQLTALEILANSGSYLERSPALTPAVSAERLNYHSDSPNITYDDAAFRNIRDANLIKVIDPQPPFGIPLGPLTQSSESDYLHAQPEERHRPTFIPSKNVDTIRDDFAFRNLRKDQKQDLKGSVNVEELDRILSGESEISSARKKKKRVVRSLSANIAGIVYRDEVVDDSRYPSGLSKAPSSNDIQEYDDLDDYVLNNGPTPCSTKLKDEILKQSKFIDAAKESQSDRESSIPYSPRNNPSWVERASLSDFHWKEVGTSSETLTDKSAVKGDRRDSTTSDVSDFQRTRASSSESQKDSPSGLSKSSSSQQGNPSPSNRLSVSSQDSYKSGNNFNAKPKPFYRANEATKEAGKKTSQPAKIENKDIVTIDEKQLQEILRDIANEAAQLSQINDDLEPQIKRDRKTSVDNIFQSTRNDPIPSEAPSSSSLDRTHKGAQLSSRTCDADVSLNDHSPHKESASEIEAKLYSPQNQTDEDKQKVENPLRTVPLTSEENLPWCDDSDVLSNEEAVPTGVVNGKRSSVSKSPDDRSTNPSHCSTSVPDSELVWRHAPKWPTEDQSLPRCGDPSADDIEQDEEKERKADEVREENQAKKKISTDRQSNNAETQGASQNRQSNEAVKASPERHSVHQSFSDESTSYGEEAHQKHSSNSSDRKSGKRHKLKRKSSSASSRSRKSDDGTSAQKDAKVKSKNNASGSETSTKAKEGKSSMLTVPGGSSQLSSDSSSMLTGDVSEADVHPRRRPSRQKDKSRKRKSNLNRSRGEESISYQQSDEYNRRRRRLSLDAAPSDSPKNSGSSLEKSTSATSAQNLTSPDLLRNAQVNSKQKSNTNQLPAIVAETLDREQPEVSDDSYKRESARLKRLPPKLSPLKKPEFPDVFKKFGPTSPGSSSSFPGSPDSPYHFPFCSPVQSPGTITAFMTSPLVEVKPPPAPESQKAASSRIIDKVLDSSPPFLQPSKKIGTERVDMKLLDKLPSEDEIMTVNPFGKLKDKLFSPQDSSSEDALPSHKMAQRFFHSNASKRVQPPSASKDKTRSCSVMLNFDVKPSGISSVGDITPSSTPMSPPRKRRTQKMNASANSENNKNNQERDGAADRNNSSSASRKTTQASVRDEVKETKQEAFASDSKRSSRTKNFKDKLNKNDQSQFLTKYDLTKNAFSHDEWTGEEGPREAECEDSETSIHSGANVLESGGEILSSTSRSSCEFVYIKSCKGNKDTKIHEGKKKQEMPKRKTSDHSSSDSGSSCKLKGRRSKSLIGIERMPSAPPSRFDQMDSELAMILRIRRSQEGNGGPEKETKQLDKSLSQSESDLKKGASVAELAAKFLETSKPEERTKKEKRTRGRRFQTQIVTLQELDDYKSLCETAYERGSVLKRLAPLQPEEKKSVEKKQVCDKVELKTQVCVETQIDRKNVEQCDKRTENKEEEMRVRHESNSTSETCSFQTAECCTPDSLLCRAERRGSSSARVEDEDTEYSTGKEEEQQTCVNKGPTPKSEAKPANTELCSTTQTSKGNTEIAPNNDKEASSAKTVEAPSETIESTNKSQDGNNQPTTSTNNNSSAVPMPDSMIKTETISCSKTDKASTHSISLVNESEKNSEPNKDATTLSSPKSPPRLRRSKNASPTEEKPSGKSSLLSSTPSHNLVPTSRLEAIKSVLLKKELTDALKQNENNKQEFKHRLKNEGKSRAEADDKKADKKSHSFLSSLMGSTSIKDRMANFRHPKNVAKDTKTSFSKQKKSEESVLEEPSDALRNKDLKEEIKKDKLKENRKSIRVEVPAPDEGVQQFFSPEKQKAPGSPAEISDQHLKDLATRDTSQKLSTRKSIKLFGRSQSSGNPVKKLAKRTDLQQAYFETKKE